MPTSDLEVWKLVAAYIGGGLAIGVTGFGAVLGISSLAGKGLEGIARQPEAGNMIRTTMILAIAFVEAIALYALVVALILVGK